MDAYGNVYRRTQPPENIMIWHYLTHWRQRMRPLLGPLLAFSVMGYFIYHAIQGDHGFLAWIKVAENLQVAERELETLTTLHNTLEHRVRLMRPESLDPDMLEEVVKLKLNLLQPEDVIVLRNQAA